MTLAFSDLHKGLIFKRTGRLFDKEWKVYYLVLSKAAKSAKIFWVRQADNTYNIFTHKITGTKLDDASRKITNDDRKEMIKLILSSRLNHVG